MAEAVRGAGAWIALAVWLALVAAVEMLPGDGPATLCTFRRVTGVPCPTCGTTRAVTAALAGRPLEALAWNPLAAAVATAGLAWTGLSLLRRRPARLALPPRTRTAAWVLAATALVVNWLYVVQQHLV